MWSKALEAFGALGDDEELGPADWPTIKRYITCLNDVEGGERLHPHTTSESDSNLDPMNLSDIRLRFLNGKFLFFYCLRCTAISYISTNILNRRRPGNLMGLSSHI